MVTPPRDLAPRFFPPRWLRCCAVNVVSDRLPHPAALHRRASSTGIIVLNTRAPDRKSHRHSPRPIPRHEAPGASYELGYSNGPAVQ
jgi:hypothetical protein